MTELVKDASSSTVRPRFQLGLVGALLIACAVAGLSEWLLFLPPRASTQLVRAEPRPELLDKPHRHRATPEPSAAPAAR